MAAAAVALAPLLAGCRGKQAEPEIHLIPAGYQGQVVILHDVPDGEPARYEDGARVYPIPPDGVLRSSTPVPDGWWGPDEVRYFYVAEDGTRTRIVDDVNSSIPDTPESRGDPTVGIYFRSFGRISYQGAPCEVALERYSVGTQAFLLDHAPGSGLELIEYLKANPVRPR
ncbi:MAG TPA: hypothetical protein VFD43_08715 [Planctomycetota bacterium]|nr:hypothetical protein [Planctomycetota bacterium]